MADRCTDPRTGCQWQCQACGKFLDPEEAFYDKGAEDLPEPYCNAACAAVAHARGEAGEEASRG